MPKNPANAAAKDSTASALPVEFYRNPTLDLADEVARHSHTSAKKREELWAAMHEDVRRLAEALVARSLK
jgi:hypothetical protein